ncbi:hypothetical protein KCP77_02445 [Salmonella enterica subsp. enterica]|nr:hypothetical protein KCP77_02445 [Salmonella enterica subsp. enterica]
MLIFRGDAATHGEKQELRRVVAKKYFQSLALMAESAMEANASRRQN